MLREWTNKPYTTTIDIAWDTGSSDSRLHGDTLVRTILHPCHLISVLHLHTISMGNSAILVDKDKALSGKPDHLFTGLNEFDPCDYEVDCQDPFT